MTKAPRRHIKSLAALFAFESSGRHLNFTLAAKELGVTQAAVSKQIALLEEDLGARLFERLYREVRLTEKGKELFAVATESLGTLSDTLVRLRHAEKARPVTIGATITMSHYWLLPRLPAFRAEHPEVQIRVVAQDEPIAVREGAVDMVIRFGDGRWDDGSVSSLFKSSIYPMASPGFLANRAPLSSPDDILSLPLIAYDAPDESWATWADWLRMIGLASRPVQPTLSFSRYFDAIQAASADQGVILVWGGLTGGTEERGALVRLPSPAIEPNGDFHLVVSGSESSRERELVRDWLISEGRRHDPAQTSVEIRRGVLGVENAGFLSG